MSFKMAEFEFVRELWVGNTLNTVISLGSYEYTIEIDENSAIEQGHQLCLELNRIMAQHTAKIHTEFQDKLNSGAGVK